MIRVLIVDDHPIFRDGLAGLLQTYRLPLAGAPKSMDLGLLYSALEQKQVDMAAANATDGMLSVLDVRVLRDDRNYFPPYQAAVIVRAESELRGRTAGSVHFSGWLVKLPS